MKGYYIEPWYLNFITSLKTIYFKNFIKKFTFMHSRMHIHTNSSCIILNFTAKLTFGSNGDNL